MTTDRVRYRPATIDDIPAEHRVFVRAEGALQEAHGYRWQGPPLSAFAMGLQHVLAHDAARSWLAELDGRVVGYTGAIVRGGTWFLSSLFVDPEAQGRGIGRRLLELASADAPPRRLTISDSIQPISNALYASAGMLPITPLIRLAGRSQGHSTGELELGDLDPEQLAAVDLEAYGFDRAIDHGYWASRWKRHGWFRDGVPVAWSYRAADGNIAPVAAIDGPTAAAVLRSELAVLGPASIEMPATARPLLATGLAAGLRIQMPMGLLLGSDDVAAPTALAISSYGLY